MMLNLMDHPNVIYGFGLMPTIEHMEKAPEGRKMSFHFTNSILLISVAFYILYFLPRFIRDAVVKVCAISEYHSICFLGMISRLLNAFYWKGICIPNLTI